METPYAIQLKDLRKRYGDVEVLKGVELNVRKGTMLALLGPNGAGKTTVVRALSTLTRPTSGTATVNGFDTVRERNGVRSSIGLVGQFVALDWMHTGRENLVMVGRLQKLSKPNAARRAEQLLEQFGLLDAGDRPVKTYSGGMKRRLDLAAGLIVTPAVLFLDEPTTGLDPRSRQVMWDVIRELLGSGITILLTTQYLEEADQLADEIAVLHGGRIIAQGTAEELKQAVGKERVEVVLATDEAFRRAGELITGEGRRTDPETRTISLVVEAPSHVKRVLDELERHGLALRSLSLTRPTLDDVFFALTGRDGIPAEPAPARADSQVGAAL
ncbi:ATP-binding cassette domain-containing protein [Micromonospora sp. DT233]|uniref:ATP-binding cassette domain-containing protein n=1 Tax=Micromonospora sp. DT233 TaxID=3393432 RepID=UPI003CEAAF42